MHQIGAAIDIGSNSIHLLVARVGGNGTGAAATLEPLDDRSELLALGEAIDRRGRLEPDKRGAIVATLESYTALARAAGATSVTLIGTEPMRRAANAAEVVALVRRSTGLTLRVASVEEECRLTFLGACAGRLPEAATTVVDIGGGTTEIGIHVPDRPFEVRSLALGSARLTWTIVEHDPPTQDEIDRLSRAARDALADLPVLAGPSPTRPRRRNTRPTTGAAEGAALFVGGSATNVARLGPLTRAALREDLRLLATLPASEVVRRYGVRPQRARQLAAGAAIVDALLERLGLDAAIVSDASLRDGAIICAARFGDAWPLRLAELLGARPQT